MCWRQIVDEYGEMIFRVAFGVLHNAHDAEEVAQDVLLEALHRDSLPDAGLLRRMAAFRSIDRLRRRHSHDSLDGGTIPAAEPFPDQLSETAEQIRNLQRAIASLPSRQARCFWLRFVEGLSNQQIAESLEISVSAVSTAIGKAKQSLRSKLDIEESKIP